MSRARQRGFTLLELLIALGIFGLVSAMAYGGLNVVLDARQRTEVQAERLAELEQALLLLGRDLVQVTGRGVRDALGDPLPPMQGGDNGPVALEFTRAGWANPGNRPRSGLQRVAWGIEDDTLIRAHWWVLDRAQDSEPYQARLLGKVQAFTVEFMDAGRNPQESWPPAGAEPEQLPMAVRVTLELEDWGRLTRLFRIVGGGT